MPGYLRFDVGEGRRVSSAMPGADRSTGTLPISIAAGAFFAALAARGFLVPLRAHELGADRFTVGLLFTLATLSGAVLSMPAGFLADRFGRRRMVVISAVAGGLSQLAIAASSSVPLDELWQIVGGLGAGAAQAALFATVADSAPGHRLGRAMGWVTLSMQLGFLAGPAIAGVLLQFIDLKTDLALTCILYAVALATTVMFPRGRGRAAAGWNIVASLQEVARSPGFWPVVIGLFASTIVWGTVQAYLPLFAKEILLLPGAAIGYLLAIQAVSNGLSRIPGGWIVDRAPRKGPIVAAGVVVYSAAVIVLPHLHGFWLPAIVLALGVPALATAFIAISVSFSNLASPERRGVAMGMYGTVLYLGLAVGPAVFGGIMGTSGYVAGFTACAVTAIGLSLVMLGLREISHRGRPAVVLPPAAPGT
jgi:MFS family permease